MIIVEGYIGKQIYANSDFKIYSFYPTPETIENVKVNEKYNNISISGTLPTLLDKVKYKLEVEEVVGKYPNSYTVSRLSSDVPKDGAYKDKFLQAMVTQRQYETLKKAYPNIVDMIINDEPIDVNKLYGIGEKKLDKIKNKVKEDFVLVELVGKYSDLGMTMNGLKKLHDTYKSIEMIDEKMEKDPYRTMVGVAGIGFKKADACLLKKYPNLIDSEERCSACVNFLIKQNEQKGNTWISMPNLYRQLMENASESSKHFDTIIKGEDFYYHPESNRISLKQTYMCEREVCNRLLAYKERHDILDINWEQYNEVDGFPLTEQQRQILRNVCRDNLNLLVGYGGCGKTFSTKALVNMLEDNMLTYLLVSPTGRASKVLSENTGRTATTIHRGLKYQPKGGFQYNLENKLPQDVIIIDEYSMIDIYLLRDLLRAIREDAKIIFIGDPDQIPSVGCGNTAFDMLKSEEISTSLLTQVFRYGDGGLSYVATQIREGKYYLTSNDQIQPFGKDKDYTFVNTNQTIPVTKSLYNKLLTQKEATPDDIMVLSAYNKGEFGTINLNNIIQAMVNPENSNKKQVSITRDGENFIFREGDKVMQITNDYKMETVDGEEYPVMNGDIGKIVSINEDIVNVSYDNTIIPYNKEALLKLTLAYSISIHKSQGSQAKYVILVTPESHTFFLNRNLLYVGVSRAKELVYHIGTTKLVKTALRKSENFNRDTWLLEMLQNRI